MLSSFAFQDFIILVVSVLDTSNSLVSETPKWILSVVSHFAIFCMSCFLDSPTPVSKTIMEFMLLILPCDHHCSCWCCHFLLFVIIGLSLPSMTNKYSTFCLPIINMPTISPFGIDGNLEDTTHSILTITLSPPLTSMSKK
jgi:hypothetical protein